MASKVTTITVNYGETINMGNYESLRIDYAATRTICDKEDPVMMMHKLRRRLKLEVSKAIKEEFGDRK